MRIFWVAAAVGLVTPAASFAQAAAQTDAPAKEEKKICQSEKMTGSLTRVRRICMTRAEWDEMRLKYKHGFEDNVRGAAGGLETKPQAGAGG